jgi:hypothetical protein
MNIQSGAKRLCQQRQLLQMYGDGRLGAFDESFLVKAQGTRQCVWGVLGGERRMQALRRE